MRGSRAPLSPPDPAHRPGGRDPFGLPVPWGQGPRTHRLQVVPGAGGEVASHFHLPGLEHRRDKQSPSPQQLPVHSPGVGVFGEPSHRRGRVQRPEVRALTGQEREARPSAERRGRATSGSLAHGSREAGRRSLSPLAWDMPGRVPPVSPVCKLCSRCCSDLGSAILCHFIRDVLSD